MMRGCVDVAHYCISLHTLTHLLTMGRSMMLIWVSGVMGRWRLESLENRRRRRKTNRRDSFCGSYDG